MVACAALVMMAVAGETAQASGTPLAFIITRENSKAIAVLVNFNSQYSQDQIRVGTALVKGLIDQYASSLGATVTVMTADELGGADADTLHDSMLSMLGNVDMYIYGKATKVDNAESGSNFRFDFHLYTSKLPIGLYIGAIEINAQLLNMFL